MALHKRNSKATRRITIILISIILVLLLLIFYFIGIVFFPSFLEKARQLPGVGKVTHFLVDSGEAGKKKTAKVAQKHSENGAVTTEKKKEEQKTAQVKLPLQARVDDTYLENAIFLGDSRTVAMVTYGYLPETQTLATVGLCHVNAENSTYSFKTTGQTYTMSQYLTSHAAKVVYLSYGINGVSYTDETAYKQAYEKLVDDVKMWKPDSKIVIQSIWPVREGYSSTQGITNEKVDAYNEFLYDLAIEKEVYFLDTQSILKDAYNSMKEEYNSGDGLHYNEAAYKDIFDYILTHPVPGIADDKK